MAIQKEAVKFRHKHLLGIQSLSIPEVNYILDESMQFVDFNKREQKKLNILTGKTQINLFFESSTRTLKSDPKEVITKTLGENAYSAFNALIASASRQTKTILVGPGAIALGFVALRANSKLKDHLLVANTPLVPAITEAIKFMGCKTIMNTKENVHPLAELALAVSALKASEL